MTNTHLSKTQDYVIMAIFIASIIAVGLLFIEIPNVEMVTATIFLAGYALGSQKGLIVAIFGELLFSLLNPFGAPSPPLLVAQLISMGLAGYAGGVLYQLNRRIPALFKKSVQLGVAGLLLTAFYDFATTFSFAIVLAETPRKIFASTISVLLMGLPFTIIHIIGNTLVFAIILPLLFRTLAKIDYFKPRLSVLALIFLCMFCIYEHPVHAQVTSTASRSTQLSEKLQNSAEDDSSHLQIKASEFDTTQTELKDLDVETASLDSASLQEKAVKRKVERIVFDRDTTETNINQAMTLQIDGQLIKNQIYQNLSDIFNEIPGFYSPLLNRPGVQPSVYKEGLPNKYIDYMYDNRPVKNPLTDDYNVNFIPIEGIRRVELPYTRQCARVNNPLSILGEHFDDTMPYTRVFFHIGPSEFNDTDVTFGRRVSSKADAQVGLTLRGNDGPLRPETYEHHQARAYVRYRLSNAWRMHYSWIYNRATYHNIGPKMADDNYATPDGRALTYRNDHTFTAKGSLFNSHYLNYTGKIYFSRENNTYSDDEFDLSFDETFNYIGLLSELEQRFGPMKFAFSGKLEHDWVNEHSFGKKSYTLGSIGLRNEWQFTDAWYVQGMIGADGRSDQNVNPNYSLLMRWLSSDKFNMSAGARYYSRFPSLFELHANEGVLGNDDLNNEEILNYFIEMHTNPLKRFSVKTKIYANRIKNPIEISSTDGSMIRFSNHDDITYSGVDLTLNFIPFRNFTFGSVFSYVKSDYDYIEHVPETRLSAYAGYKNTFFEGDLVADIRIE